jgi:ketosteroid isomerase-like protein
MLVDVRELQAVRVPVREPSGSAVSAEEALALPPGDEARTEFLQQLAERLTAAAEDGTPETLGRECTEDIEMVILQDEEGNVWGGDFSPVYRGVEGLRAAFAQWNEPWEELRLELNELVDLGGDEVIVIGTWYGRGRGSGVEISAPYPAKYTLRGDKVCRIEFIDLDETLRELGV